MILTSTCKPWSAAGRVLSCLQRPYELFQRIVLVAFQSLREIAVDVRSQTRIQLTEQISDSGRLKLGLFVEDEGQQELAVVPYRPRARRPLNTNVLQNIGELIRGKKSLNRLRRRAIQKLGYIPLGTSLGAGDEDRRRPARTKVTARSLESRVHPQKYFHCEFERGFCYKAEQ